MTFCGQYSAGQRQFLPCRPIRSNEELVHALRSLEVVGLLVANHDVHECPPDSDCIHVIRTKMTHCVKYDILCTAPPGKASGDEKRSTEPPPSGQPENRKGGLD